MQKIIVITNQPIGQYRLVGDGEQQSDDGIYHDRSYEEIDPMVARACRHVDGTVAVVQRVKRPQRRPSMLRPVEQVFGEIDRDDIDDCREDDRPSSVRQSDQAPAQRSDAENGDSSQKRSGGAHECVEDGMADVEPGPVCRLPPLGRRDSLDRQPDHKNCRCDDHKAGAELGDRQYRFHRVRKLASVMMRTILCPRFNFRGIKTSRKNYAPATCSAAAARSAEPLRQTGEDRTKQRRMPPRVAMMRHHTSSLAIQNVASMMSQPGPTATMA